MRLVLSKWEEMELAELIVNAKGNGQVFLPIDDVSRDDEICIVCSYRFSNSMGSQRIIQDAVDTYALTIDEIYLDVNGITVDIEVEYDAGRIDTYVSQILNQR